MLTRLADMALSYLTERRPGIVISGMALGWDTAVAMAALDARIPLVAADADNEEENKSLPQAHGGV